MNAITKFVLSKLWVKIILQQGESFEVTVGYFLADMI